LKYSLLFTTVYYCIQHPESLPLPLRKRFDLPNILLQFGDKKAV
jgi:hypothetical protein